MQSLMLLATPLILAHTCFVHYERNLLFTTTSTSSGEMELYETVKIRSQQISSMKAISLSPAVPPPATSFYWGSKLGVDSQESMHRSVAQETEL